jgi:hypothetical protein
MKRKLLSGLVIGWAIASIGSTAGAISLEFVPSDQTAVLGNPVDVGIRISGLNDFAPPSLGTFDLDVAFDPTILSFDHVSYGDPLLGDQLDLLGLGSIQITTPGLGFVNLFELSFDPIGDLNALQQGDFLLATLTFNTLALGTAPLGISINTLGDAAGDALIASAGRGTVSVVPEPATLLLMGSGLIGIWGGKRLLRHRID